MVEGANKEPIRTGHLYFRKDDLPRFFPLTSLRFGNWQSQLHLPDQLFFYIGEDKFIFLVVHPPKQ